MLNKKKVKSYYLNNPSSIIEQATTGTGSPSGSTNLLGGNPANTNQGLSNYMSATSSATKVGTDNPAERDLHPHEHPAFAPTGGGEANSMPMQIKAPDGTVENLSYINEEEARLLKDRGASGVPTQFGPKSFATGTISNAAMPSYGPAPANRDLATRNLGYDHQVLEQAKINRMLAMNQMMGLRGGFADRSAQAFGRAETAFGSGDADYQRARGLSEQSLRGIGQDREFYRGLEGESRQLGAQLDAATGVYQGQLDRLLEETGRDPVALQQALSAQRQEDIGRQTAGQRLAMERTMGARGIDPTSMKALTALGGLESNALAQTRQASRNSFADARGLQQQRLGQRAQLYGQRFGAGVNTLGARQNLLQNLRAGRGQERAFDSSLLQQGIQDRLNLGGSERQFGISQQAFGNVGLGQMIGLDQAQIQDAVFDQNRQEQKLLSAWQIQSGIDASEAQTQATKEAANQQASANEQAGMMQAIGTIAMVKVAFSCIPEGTVIDIGEESNVGVCIEDLKPGDVIAGYYGNPVQVLQKHEYLEGFYKGDKNRFLTIIFSDGEEVNLCDTHRVMNTPSGELNIGDKVGTRTVADILRYGDVTRSYDLLTSDNKGYKISGIPVNSMIEEMARVGFATALANNLQKAA